MLDFIFNIIKPCFKHLNNTKLSSLSKAIACVAIGLRTSHLIDVAYLDLDQAKALLSKLRKNCDCQSLILIQFKDRFTFLCNKNALKHHIHATLDAPNQWTYVAVEGQEPVKSDPPMHLIAWLQDKLLPFLSLSDTHYYSPVVPTFMVALTGWALEYPVIYTTHLNTDDPEGELDEWEVRLNCLGSRTLNVIQIWIEDHMLLSFSCPYSLFNDTVEQHLKHKIDHRLDDVASSFDWLSNRCVIKKEQIKLDRFAL